MVSFNFIVGLFVGGGTAFATGAASGRRWRGFAAPLAPADEDVEGEIPLAPGLGVIVADCGAGECLGATEGDGDCLGAGDCRGREEAFGAGEALVFFLGIGSVGLGGRLRMVCTLL